MQEQHVEQTVRSKGVDQNKHVCTYNCHGSAAAQIFPKKLVRHVSERAASTARSESFKKSPRSVQFVKFINVSHERFSTPIYSVLLMVTKCNEKNYALKG